MSVWVGVAGAAAVLAWLLAAPPWRDGPGGLLRVAAAALLLAGLFEVKIGEARAAAQRAQVLQLGAAGHAQVSELGKQFYPVE